MSETKQQRTRRRFSISTKIYLFVTMIVLVIAGGTAVISYLISARQIDNYFKRLAYNTAENYASLSDPDFLARLRVIAESDEYQAIRDQAEEDDDEAAIQAYFEEQGIWEEYQANQAALTNYLSHMDDIKYLYIVALGDKNAMTDMYLLDDDENPIYETGYFEDREPELYGVEPEKRIEPTINNGDWGWLCSAYAGVYDAQGDLVCHVGCDVDMSEIMAERYRYFAAIIVAAVIQVLLVVICAIFFANRVIISPLASITKEMQRFKPGEDTDYEKAGVMELKLKSRDEVYDIYQAIRTMQMHIIDYLNELSAVQRAKEQALNSLEQAESDIKDKEEQIGEISKQIYRDALTSVGNKAGYVQKTEELARKIADRTAEFAIVMVDLNDLKRINDELGHRAGDAYIKGSCHLVCYIYKHSPVFRIGGDEFVVILEGEDYENRKALLEETRAAFARSFANTDAPPQERYSASVGMAEYSADDYAVELVFRRADSAMFEEKKRFKEQHGSYR
ncbi:MAG: GGDEF domain-containing protein [Oscillospiraceae bacterium]|nr:GGDEF domain-containing protein [Oscillospiraceae bacterium]